MKNIIICEKPSVARTIAGYLGTFEKHTDKGIGYMENNKWVITWCFGHLITLCYPEEYDESLKLWSLDTLPFLPNEYKYRVITNTKKQFDIIRKIYHRTDIDTLYYCPDPAREGVLIQHLVRKCAGLNENIKEKVMWIDSITEAEVKRAIKEAKPVTEFDNIRDAGLARSIEDYAFGINFSRGLTKRFERTTGGHAPIAVGRVMTCVLGMIVDREREIENFVPTNFYKIDAQTKDAAFSWKATKGTNTYEQIVSDLYNETGFKDEYAAQSFVNKLGQNLIIESKEIKQEKKNAPLLFNLAELQATCSKMFKISPAQTLEVAQSLYEKRLTTYPRTDARVLSSAIAKEIDANLYGLKKLSNTELSDCANDIIINGRYIGIEKTRYVDDNKIEDHYAIIPTGDSLSALKSCSDLERRIYELIVKRFLSIFLPAAEYEKTTIVAKDNIKNERFYLSGSVLRKPGYLNLVGIPVSKDELSAAISKLKNGDILPCEYKILKGSTQPPKHYTTGSMILAMENAGNLIENEELRAEIKGSGIGTSATRAATLEKLVTNKYLSLATKTQTLSVAPFGNLVYEVVKQTVPDMLNPKMTAEWERGLSLIADGKLSKDKYLEQLNKYITHYIGIIKNTTPNNTVSEFSKSLPEDKKKKTSKSNVQRYLNVPYDEKDEAKKLGAWFDGAKKKWYVPKGVDVNKFKKWL